MHKHTVNMFEGAFSFACTSSSFISLLASAHHRRTVNTQVEKEEEEMTIYYMVISFTHIELSD